MEPTAGFFLERGGQEEHPANGFQTKLEPTAQHEAEKCGPQTGLFARESSCGGARERTAPLQLNVDTGDGTMDITTLSVAPATFKLRSFDMPPPPPPPPPHRASHGEEEVAVHFTSVALDRPEQHHTDDQLDREDAAANVLKAWLAESRRDAHPTSVGKRGLIRQEGGSARRDSWGRNREMEQEAVRAVEETIERNREEAVEGGAEGEIVLDEHKGSGADVEKEGDGSEWEDDLEPGWVYL